MLAAVSRAAEPSPRVHSQGFIFGQFRESTRPARAAVEGADCFPRRRQPS
jgi:hypothetical protein